MNPYDFVPAEAGVQRGRAAGHHDFSGHNGVLNCTLVTETPIFIPDTSPRSVKFKNVAGAKGELKKHKELSFIKVGKTPIIPGSSLKGVIRTVAEAAGNGCFLLFKGKYSDKGQEFSYLLDDEYLKERCNSRDTLCICCRIFGKTNSRTEHNHLGKVNIGEARAEEFTIGKPVTLAILSSPKPRHSAFYSREPGSRSVAGRKYYFHGRAVLTGKESDQNVTVAPVMEGSTFSFSVRYVNLTDDELSLLLYALVLEPEMRHKIGMGKPAGLGSVKILVKSIKVIAPAQRYTALGKGIKELTGEELNQFMDERIKAYKSSEAANMQALRRIWRWPPQHDIAYPGLSWFKEKPNAPISET